MGIYYLVDVYHQRMCNNVTTIKRFMTLEFKEKGSVWASNYQFGTTYQNSVGQLSISLSVVFIPRRLFLPHHSSCLADNSTCLVYFTSGSH